MGKTCVSVKLPSYLGRPARKSEGALPNDRTGDLQCEEIQLVSKAINREICSVRYSTIVEVIRSAAKYNSCAKRSTRRSERSLPYNHPCDPHCAEIPLVSKAIIKEIRRVRPLMNFQMIRSAATSRSGRFTTIAQVLRKATKYNL